jgi:curved DNA-binding protein CbpA
MTTGPLDPYKVLQVDSEAEDEVIQAAYRRLAQKYHPDVASGPEAAARMAGINAAWEILRDPAKRAAHDLSRRLAARDAERAAAAGSASASHERGQPHRSTTSAAASGGAGAGTAQGGRASPGASASGAGPSPRGPETVSSDWTSGRSSQGGGYDPSQMGSPDGFAAAGPPPGDPSGSVLNFGRFAGWSLGEIARRDLDYIEWLDRMPIGRSFRDELDVILRQAGRRKSAPADAQDRRGLFRRR